MDEAIKEIKAIQLSEEHNASIVSVREGLRSLHPDDPQIVVMKHQVWRVKGLIQISRSIGDAYLKKGSACLQGGICLSSMGRPAYERVVAWKVLNEEENAHCMFMNWSFV